MHPDVNPFYRRGSGWERKLTRMHVGIRWDEANFYGKSLPLQEFTQKNYILNINFTLKKFYLQKM